MLEDLLRLLSKSLSDMSRLSTSCDSDSVPSSPELSEELDEEYEAESGMAAIME